MPTEPIAVSANSPPVLSGNQFWNVSLGVSSTYTVSVTDPDNDDITVSMEADIDGGSFDTQTLTVTWTPQTLQAFVLKYE